MAAVGGTIESGGAEAVDEGEGLGVGVRVVEARSEPLLGAVVGERDPLSLPPFVDLAVASGCEAPFSWPLVPA